MGFGAVSNAKCLVCHDGPLHSDRQVFNGPDKLTKIVERKFSGEVEVEAGTQKVAVPQGSTARYAADVPHRITNKAKRRARALLVVAS